MTSKQLRNSILQYAIQGKLVKQDSSDEPASKLIKDIYDQKLKLVLEGKLKKNKNESFIYKNSSDNLYYEKIGEKITCIQKEIPFEIPNNWEWVRLDSISIIFAGGTPNRSNNEYWNNGNIPWLKISDLTKSIKYVNNSEEFITELGLKNSSAKIFQINTILYSIFATIGEVRILNFNASTNQAIAGINLYDTNIVDFVYLYLYSLKGAMFLKASGTSQFNINQSILKATLIPVPPLNEQKRMVKKLNELEPLITLYEQYEQSLSRINDEFPKQLEKSILQYAIQGKLVKQDVEADGYAKTLIDEISKQKQLLVAKKEIKQNKQESFIFKGQDNKHYEKIGDKTICIQEEIPFEIPSNWEWVRLKTISEKITDGTHKTPNYVKYGIPFLSVQNISKGKFNFKEIKYITKDEHKILSKRVNPRIGDILMCRIGTLGKAIINNLNFNFSIFVSLSLIRLINTKLNYFIVNTINSPFGINWIENYKIGGNTHTFKINLNNLSNFLLPIPPLKEQKRIINNIDSLLKKIKILKFEN